MVKPKQCSFKSTTNAADAALMRKKGPVASAACLCAEHV